VVQSVPRTTVERTRHAGVVAQARPGLEWVCDVPALRLRREHPLGAPLPRADLRVEREAGGAQWQYAGARAIRQAPLDPREGQRLRDRIEVLRAKGRDLRAASA